MIISDDLYIVSTDGLRGIKKHWSGNGHFGGEKDRYHLDLVYDDGHTVEVSYKNQADRNKLFEEIKKAMQEKA